MAISQKDVQILRDLAKQQADIAHSKRMQGIVRDWVAHGSGAPSRPMVTIEYGTFADEVVTPYLVCEGERAREIEARLRGNLVGHLLFEDDAVVEDCLTLTYDAWMTPFDIPVTKDAPQSGNSLGHHFAEVITDLKEDFALLKPSPIVIAKEQAEQQQAELSELFGDILPVEIRGRGLYACPTQDIVHIMSMETMYLSMYDYPDQYHAMMDRLTDDYLALFARMEQEGMLLSTTGSERVAQGTYAYTDRLPNDLDHYTTRDIWGFMDSQETVGISSDMFAEFIFPYYKKVSDMYGLLSYGCCEPVHPIWEQCLSKLSNLGRVSISPWCDEAYMGERLRGTRVIYHRKPNPNFLGVDVALDEEAVRAHIRQTVQAARGCTLEFTQRDVYTIHNNPDKVKRFVQMIREETADFS